MASAASGKRGVCSIPETGTENEDGSGVGPGHPRAMVRGEKREKSDGHGAGALEGGRWGFDPGQEQIENGNWCL